MKRRIIKKNNGVGSKAPRKKSAAGQRVGGEAPAELSRSQVPRMVMVSDQPWPRVMRQLPVRGRRSVDRGRVSLKRDLRQAWLLRIGMGSINK